MGSKGIEEGGVGEGKGREGREAVRWIASSSPASVTRSGGG